MERTPTADHPGDTSEKFLNALAENYLLQDAILNAAELTVISLREDGVISTINKAGEPMLGYSSHELIGLEKLTLFHETAELQKRADELRASGYLINDKADVLLVKAKRRITDHSEWTYQRKDGSNFPAELSMTGIWNEQNELTGFLAIISDITEERKAELARQHYQIHLEAVTHELRNQNHQLNEFAHIISHNLRSPVGNIGALISLLNEKSTLNDYKTIFEKLRLASRNLQDTLNDLMETLMIKEQNQSERVPLQFDEIFKKIREGFSGEILKFNAVITHNFTACPGITYSKPYLESILLNLLSNAIKYRAPQRPLRVHFETFMEDGREVLCVSDNALGIDMDRYGHQLFNLRKTFHEHQDARGVGLFLTRTQVETMGGSISATSEPGKGSTFTIRF